MFTVILKNSIQTPRLLTVHAASIVVEGNNYCTKPYIIKNPTTASLKRGTGGRSSFNGIVCTVFGNTGFIGSALCNRLGKTGTQLILPHRKEFYHCRDLKLVGDLGQVIYTEFHLQDEDSIYKAMKYSNVVVNLVGSDWPTMNFSYEDVNVEGARRIAKIAKQTGVERFIHVSALNASPNPKPLMLKNGSQFLKSKWEGECAVKEEFPEATIIRPAVTYGMEDRFISFYVNSFNTMLYKAVLWKKGKETIKQPVYVGDVVAGITATVLDNNTAGKTYQFVGPERYKLADLVDWFWRLAKYEEWAQLDDPIDDLETNFLFQLKVSLNELTSFTNRRRNLHWEGIEKDSTTDLVLNLPTLEDLGVPLTFVEGQVPWVARMYKMVYRRQVCEADPDIRPPQPVPF